MKRPIKLNHHTQGSAVSESKGFTIVELLIATVVFSMVLVVMVAGMMQAGSQYSAGIISSDTQATARSIMDQISQQIQFGGSAPVEIDNAPYDGWCLGNNRYSYIKDQQLDLGSSTNRYIFMVDTVSGGCQAQQAQKLDTPPVKGAELLAPGMRLAALEIAPVTGTPINVAAYKVQVKVIFGPSENLYADGFPAIPGYHQSCLDGRASACTVADLQTIVERRL